MGGPAKNGGHTVQVHRTASHEGAPSEATPQYELL